MILLQLLDQVPYGQQISYGTAQSTIKHSFILDQYVSGESVETLRFVTVKSYFNRGKSELNLPNANDVMVDTQVTKLHDWLLDKVLLDLAHIDFGLSLMGPAWRCN